MTTPRSTDAFLTTHTGSLPRPADLIRMMYAKEEGVPVDAAALGARIRAAVAEAVQKQVKAGVAIVNDGEMSKPSYATYVKDRLNGFGGASHPLTYRDLVRDGVCGVFIADKLGVSQPTASEHLRILVHAGLVRAKRIKQWTFYQRNEKRIAEVKRAFRSAW